MGAKLLLVAFLVITTAGHPIWAQVVNDVVEVIKGGLDGLSSTFDQAADNLAQMSDIVLDNIVNEETGPTATANGTNP
ncbi:unnamed protein product [Miscanthus lutarioriparius]|uniref:Salivary secreted peptide n=1 Tax=Miscanthus lutarioriparius TaxID=422564 RepID=A0A811Q3Z7_9POAL|nr:unnamed protein product [Miscanthus lutarioriparius]